MGHHYGVCEDDYTIRNILFKLILDNYGTR